MRPSDISHLHMQVDPEHPLLAAFKDALGAADMQEPAVDPSMTRSEAGSGHALGEDGSPTLVQQ